MSAALPDTGSGAALLPVLIAGLLAVVAGAILLARRVTGRHVARKH